MSSINNALLYRLRIALSLTLFAITRLSIGLPCYAADCVKLIVTGQWVNGNMSIVCKKHWKAHTPSIYIQPICMGACRVHVGDSLWPHCTPPCSPSACAPTHPWQLGHVSTPRAQQQWAPWACWQSCLADVAADCGAGAAAHAACCHSSGPLQVQSGHDRMSSAEGHFTARHQSCLYDTACLCAWDDVTHPGTQP